MKRDLPFPIAACKQGRCRKDGIVADAQPDDICVELSVCVGDGAGADLPSQSAGALSRFGSIAGNDLLKRITGGVQRQAQLPRQVARAVISNGGTAPPSRRKTR